MAAGRSRPSPECYRNVTWVSSRSAWPRLPKPNVVMGPGLSLLEQLGAHDHIRSVQGAWLFAGFVTLSVARNAGFGRSIPFRKDIWLVRAMT
jgi:hypothetical protein